MSKNQTFTMLIGPSASGKSSWANFKFLKSPSSIRIVSTDKIRGELFGDESIQKNHSRVFQIARTRIVDFLNDGFSVIFDATNLNMKDRRPTLAVVPKDITKIAMVFATCPDICIERDLARDRSVGKEVIHRQICKFQTPLESEGFDEIRQAIDGENELNSWNSYINLMDGFDQKNKHHSLTLGEHCEKTATFIFYDEIELLVAAKFHDIGKLFTQTFIDANGNLNENAHYYSHENYGAYLFLCFFVNGLNISRLICYHMMPYNWKTDKIKDKWFKIFGKDLFEKLIILHNADKLAH